MTIRQSSRDRQKTMKENKSPCCNVDHEGTDNSYEEMSNASADVSSEEEVHCKEQQFYRCSRLRQNRYHKGKPHGFITNKQDLIRERLHKRSGSLQRQKLLEIIQANMDKNNFGLQTSR